MASDERFEEDTFLFPSSLDRCDDEFHRSLAERDMKKSPTATWTTAPSMNDDSCGSFGSWQTWAWQETSYSGEPPLIANAGALCHGTESCGECSSLPLDSVQARHETNAKQSTQGAQQFFIGEDEESTIDVTARQRCTEGALPDVSSDPLREAPTHPAAVSALADLSESIWDPSFTSDELSQQMRPRGALQSVLHNECERTPNPQQAAESATLPPGSCRSCKSFALSRALGRVTTVAQTAAHAVEADVARNHIDDNVGSDVPSKPQRSNVLHTLWDDDEELELGSKSGLGVTNAPPPTMMLPPRSCAANKLHIALSRPNGRVKGLVIMCPGSDRAADSRTAPGSWSDEDAIFPMLMRSLGGHGIASGRVSWAHRSNDLLSSVEAVLTAALICVKTLKPPHADAGPRSPRSQRVPPELRVCLIGHAFGGAVALAAAAGLRKILSSGVADAKSRLVGICTLAAQCATTFDEEGLEGLPKMLVHGGADTTTPPAVGRQLYECMMSPKEMIEIPSGTHHFQTCKNFAVEVVRGFILDAMGGSCQWSTVWLPTHDLTMKEAVRLVHDF